MAWVPVQVPAGAALRAALIAGALAATSGPAPADGDGVREFELSIGA